jgi:hypothetical protein
MDMQRLKTLKLNEPFQPFYLLLNDGKRLFVESPDLIAIAPDGSRVGISGDEGVTLIWPKNVKAVDVLATSKQH